MTRSQPDARLEFFGLGIDVSGSELPDFAFHFGPHVSSQVSRSATPEPAALCINLTPLVGRATAGSSLHTSSHDRTSSHDGLARELVVSRPDGVVVLRRSIRGWSNVPPPVPPLAAMNDRYAVTPAVVLAKGDRVLALLGSPQGARASVAMSLAHHGWRFVSGQLLVTDRSTGATMPFLTPLELRGHAATTARAEGLVDGSWRLRGSELTGEVLQVRPESVGGVVPVRSQGGPATIVRLCDRDDDRVVLSRSDFSPQTWPVQARATVRHRGSYVLQLPQQRAAEEAAAQLDLEFAPCASEDRKVVPIKPFLPAARG